MTKITGYISVAELNNYKKIPVGDYSRNEPTIVEVWKDEEDYRDCYRRVHLKKVEITLKE